VSRVLEELDRASFAALLGQAFEQASWIADAVWERAPFTSLDELDRALRAVIAEAPEARRLELVRAHPDLAGKAAVAGELSATAASEQASAGLDRLTPAQHARFTELNAAYRDRFGFPFVICVRDHTRDSILQAFEVRLEHGRDEELSTALGQVARIARLRMEDAGA
jgi:2-oxo-4-hydroxy-4-carboxy-5-ureidoimidazoline decarboxylase